MLSSVSYHVHFKEKVSFHVGSLRVNERHTHRKENYRKFALVLKPYFCNRLNLSRLSFKNVH